MTDVLELLKDADPVELDRLRAEAPPADRLEAILASGREGQRAKRRRSPLRMLVPAGGLAAVVAVALLLVAGGEGRSVDSAAAAALKELADAARAHPPTLPPGDDRFLYFRTESKAFLAKPDEPPFNTGIRTRDDFGFLLEFESIQEAWVGEDRGRLRNAAGTPRLASPRDRRVWERAGRPKLPGAYDQESPHDTGIERLRLPADPDALLAELRARARDEGKGDSRVFSTLIPGYLREWGVTPEQRATLYEAAARLPEVELLGERRDPEGRPGVGFAMVDEESENRQTLILDKDTGLLLAEIWQPLPGGPIPPRATGYHVFRAPVLVDAAGERP
jgi:hypothetical protein